MRYSAVLIDEDMYDAHRLLLLLLLLLSSHYIRSISSGRSKGVAADSDDCTLSRDGRKRWMLGRRRFRYTLHYIHVTTIFVSSSTVV